MELIALTNDFLRDKITPYVDYLNSTEVYTRYHIDNILYGVDLRETKNNNIKFTIYNLLGVLDGNCAELDVIVNPKTFEYQIKPKALYGSLSYTIPIEDTKDIYKSGKVVFDKDLSDNDKLIFNGVIANTLYQTFYGYYKRNHPIMHKHLQFIVFNKIEDDNL